MGLVVVGHKRLKKLVRTSVIGDGYDVLRVQRVGACSAGHPYPQRATSSRLSGGDIPGGRSSAGSACSEADRECRRAHAAEEGSPR